MANWQKSIRELTTEQTSDGTTIDGNRLERMLADAVRRFNAIRRGDRVRAWVPTTYVGGYTPSYGLVDGTASTQASPPFVPIFHDRTVNVVPTIPTPLGLPSNPFRNKGQKNLNVVPNTPATQDQLAWTTAFFFRRPVIVSAYSLTMMAPKFPFYKGNTFHYVTAAHPLPWPQGDPWSDDLFVQLAVDNPFSPEARMLADTEITRANFRLDAWRYSANAAAPATPLLPLFAPNAAYVAANKLRIGVCLEMENLNLPLPANSRARLCLTIPRYPTGFNSGWTPAGGGGTGAVDELHPWARQSWSWTLTVLEPIL